MRTRFISSLAMGLTAVAVVLSGCTPGTPSPAQTTGGTASQGTGTASAPAVPADVLSDAQLEALARAVVQSRDPRGAVRDTRSLRGNLAFQGLTVDEATTPGECSPFRLRSPMAQEARALDTGASLAAGTMPFAPGQSETTVIAFMLRSASPDVLAKAGFDYPDDLPGGCSAFERTFSVSRAAGMSPETSTVSAQLVPAPHVGEKSYATTQKSKGLGAADRGTAAMQVLSGTVSLDMAVLLWPVSEESTARATEAMAGFARDVVAQAAAGAGQEGVPSGARSPAELEGLLADFTDSGGTDVYMGPRTSRTIPSLAAGPSEPAQARCAFDDSAYFGALAGRATLAEGGSSTAEKMTSLVDVAIISMGSAIPQPYPFDARAQAVADCSSIQSSVQGQAPATWSSVGPLASKPTGDSAYGFKYMASDGSGRWFLRLGARRGNLTVEVSTFSLSPIPENEVGPSAERGVATINAVFAKAGL
jgi:hypothetical protein